MRHRGSGYTLFLTPNEAVFSLRGNEIVRMKLVGSNPTARVGGEKELSGKRTDDTIATNGSAPAKKDVGFCSLKDFSLHEEASCRGKK